MKNRQEKQEMLKKAGKELKDAVKNIMEECTQIWSDKMDKFDNEDAKSGLCSNSIFSAWPFPHNLYFHVSSS
jgi:hypothetical protein